MKLSPFADNMTAYIEDSKESTKKLLDLLSEFSMITGYKVNIKINYFYILAINNGHSK